MFSSSKAHDRNADIETGPTTSKSADDDDPSRLENGGRSTTKRPSAAALTRSQSLGAIRDSNDEPPSEDKNDSSSSYLYTFLLDRSAGRLRQGMPHSDPGYITTGPDDSAAYHLVLDNYVEYADDTKIPRLRGHGVHPVRAAIQNSHWALLCCTVTGSCFLTYSLSQYEPKLSPDLAQAVVITLMLATFPEVAASSGAGAFAGMASSSSIPHYGWLALLAGLVSCLWLLFHQYKILVGCGGRLGTTAFLAMNITVACFGMPVGSVPWNLYGDADRLWSERLEVAPSIASVVACTLLSALGGAVRLQSKIPLNPVQAPTTLALLGMLILEPTGLVYTEQIASGLAVGSFVAMASEQYLPSVVDFAGAGFLAGLWILLLDPFFLGFGGKKGFTAFCGFATYVTISRWIFQRGGQAARQEKK